MIQGKVARWRNYALVSYKNDYISIGNTPIQELNYESKQLPGIFPRENGV